MKAFLTFVLLLCGFSTFAQRISVDSLRNSFKNYNIKNIQEKLFLHTDRSFYIAGEILWFKIYNTQATTNQLLDLSKVAYVEVLDKDNEPFVQAKIVLNEGLGSGSLYLPVSLETGNYKLRAYTRWMRNFSPDFYFEQTISVINTFSKPVLKDQVADTYDIQFLPESGIMLLKADNRVACKVLDNFGNSVAYKAVLVNEYGDTLQNFSSHKFGMGQFSIKPDSTRNYKAIFTINDQTVEKALPKIMADGYAIRVDNKNSDLNINVHAPANTSTLNILIHNNQQIKKLESLSLQNGNAALSITESELGTGINHITLFTTEGKPVAERLYFVFPEENPEIAVDMSQAAYGTRSKAELSLTSSAEKRSSLSIAIFQNDDLSNRQSPNIRSWLYLLSDLKGHIENPQYYFGELTEEKKQAMDNLMLTQGWSRFAWEDILTPQYKNIIVPELEGHIVEAYVTDKETGTPGNWVDCYLAFPGQNFQYYSTKSAANGYVIFNAKNVEGQRNTILQGYTATDSTWKFDVLSPYSKDFSESIIPAFDIDISKKDVIESRSIGMQTQNVYLETKINEFQQQFSDTLPFYGNPDQKYLLDDYTRFPTMEEVMREYVPRVLVRKNKGKYNFKVLDMLDEEFFNTEPLILLDGMPILNTNDVINFDPFKIKKLDVVTRRFIMDKVNFTGIVSYFTYNHDYTWQKPDDKAIVFTYDGMQLKREFYSPAYTSNDQKSGRIPDFRSLLYWNPDIVLKEGEKANYSFYTSDKPGKYTGVIQGITNSGKPVYKSFEFEVSDSSN
ncbi:hypothetical protein [Chondrinema litorale]|uniref:hypothetical protein n=1 Tax=Chondrinema litorale TaxID=2994555 RepID=UPI0025428B2A|nr:hypothetical protein [Chondrinema litorale]UZR97244.1 hypothetical protein OQ292_25425 [Chondrinema litorale]